MGLFTTKRLCQYCREVHKVSKKTGTFKPHSTLTGIIAHQVPSRDVEPSLRDRGPTTRIESGVWRMCYGSERRPWPMVG